MADANVKVDGVEEVAENEVVESEPKKTDSTQAKGAEKKFTDADMAAVRRSKEKELTTARDSWEAEKATLRSTIEGQEATIKKVVDMLRKDVELDEDVMGLLEGKPVAEQLEWLLKKAEKQTDIPRTPKGEGKRPQKYTFKITNTV